MFYIGCHLSPSAGLRAMGETALSIGATTLQFFTRNPRGSKAKPIDPADAAALMALCREQGFGPLVAHAPYTINACSKDERTREFAHLTLADDWLSSGEKDDDGMSLVYVNTKTGEAMLEEIQSEIEYTDVTSERTNMEVYAHDRYDRGKKKIWMNAWRGRGYPYVSGRMFHKLHVRWWLCREMHRWLSGISRRIKKRNIEKER